MRKKTLGYTFVGSFERQKYVFKEILQNLNKEIKNYYFIDLSYLIFKINPNKKYLKKKNYFFPKNYTELDEFLKQHQLITFVSLGKTFEYFRTLFLFKKNDVKLILNMSIGVKKEFKFFKKKIFSLKNERINFLIFRFFVLINIFPKIDHMFEGSIENINLIKKQIGHRIYKFFPFIDIRYIRNLHHINCRAYDSFLNLSNKAKEDYIVFLDGGFDHPDVKRHGLSQSKENREKYYFFLNKILLLLKKFYKKKIVFCVHPKVKSSVIKKHLSKKIKVIKYKTQYYILRAHTTVSHESSTTFDALILKKRLINLNSRLMGPFYYDRNKYYPNRINIPSYEMENYQMIKKKDIDKFFKKKKNLYDSFIKNFVINLKQYKLIYFGKKNAKLKNKYDNLPGSLQILKTIKKQYF
tara:strand:- start:287 stop:1516 length:1230 start_codon:yes stop_codon:yes gene_type:complete